MRFIIALILIIHCCALANAQTRNPISHEKMWMLQRVGAPAISPDGKWVVFSLTEPSYDEKEQVSDLWITASDGNSAPRRLTTGRAGEGSYCWSPDGKYIAFTAKREADEVSQIYLLNFKEGGEAQRFTQLSTGASSPQWSPDGKYLLFKSSVFPGCYADSCQKRLHEERKKIKYNARIYTSFPIRDWDKWKDEKQTHFYVQHLDSLNARNLFIHFKQSTQIGFVPGNACWTTDSRGIVLSATIDWHTTAYKESVNQLFYINMFDLEIKQLTNESNLSNSEPQFSPDGKYLFCKQMHINEGNVYNIERIVRFNWPELTNVRNITPSLDFPIAQFYILQESIFFEVEQYGRDIIFKSHLDGLELRRWDTVEKGCLHHLSFSKEKPAHLVCNYESIGGPSEIAWLGNDGRMYPITRFNQARLDSLQLSNYETFWFKSKKGKNIRSLLIKPPFYQEGKKYPLFVVMHGGPAGSWKENWSYRWNYHLLAQPGYVILLTDYTGSTGYGERFSQEIILDPFKGPADEINEAAAYAIQKYPFIDGSRQAAGGASYGGHLANWMQATTTHYKCLVSHAGLVNSISQWGTSDYIYNREVMNGGTPWSKSKIWKEQNPLYYADRFKTPMLVTVGELDYRVPVNNSIENWNILQRMKIPSKLIVFPDENHWILKAENSRFFYKELHAWLKNYLEP